MDERAKGHAAVAAPSTESAREIATKKPSGVEELGRDEYCWRGFSSVEEASVYRMFSET